MKSDHKEFRKRNILLPLSIIFILSIFSCASAQPTTEKEEANVLISKNTTLEELETIKENLDAKGFGFQYSNVEYNDNGEIISISIQYTDANNNSGKYSVSRGGPINTIAIVSDGNRISVKSEGSGNKASISQGNGNIQNNNEKLQEEITMEMEERRKEMEKKMADRQNEMKLRRERMRADMQQRRDSIVNSSRHNQPHFKGKTHVISKTTTDEELLELTKSYQPKNISFLYENLKRNDAGEITQISITVDNGRGSVSTSTFGNGSTPVKNIQVMVDETHTIMKSME